MKKLTTLVLTLLLLTLSLSGMAVSADDAVYLNYISVSDDLKTITVGNTEYCRFNGNIATFNYDVDHKSTLVLPDKVAKDIRYYTISCSNNLAYEIVYVYNDGAMLTSYYLRRDYVEDFEKVEKGDGVPFHVNYWYPRDNVVYGNLADLKGDKTVLYDKALWYCDYHTVYTQKGMLECMQGYLIIIDDDYYFFDTTEQSDVDVFNGREKLEVYTVTDEKLLSDLRAATQAYYDDDLGFLEDGALAKDFSVVFLVALFGAIPLAVFVLSIILALRKKGNYKNQQIVLATVTGLLLAVFTLLVYLFMNA